MNRIKKVWEENRVLLVLCIILIICIEVVCVVSLTYFYGSSDSVYGNRLDEIESIPLNKKLFEDIESKLKENENVKKISTNQKGKIIYINIDFADGTLMDDAKLVALSTVELFNEDELSVYDLEFTISSLSTGDFVGYTLMGARNANGVGEIVWNNYNIEVENDEEVEQ